MKLGRRKFLHLAAGAAGSSATLGRAHADTYPNKPIRLVVPVPPGGTFDIVARLVAQAMAGRLNQQIVIETFLHGTPMNVTAARLGVPAGTARSRLHYALDNLRRQLEPNCLAA